mgnify:CR=1 FL=1
MTSPSPWSREGYDSRYDAYQYPDANLTDGGYQPGPSPQGPLVGRPGDPGPRPDPYPPVRYEQPQYEQPHYEQPHYEQPQYEQPQYAQSQYEPYQSAPALAPYHQQGLLTAYTEPPTATTILVLGIIGISCCSFCGPIALGMSVSARRRIAAGEYLPSGKVTAGFALGLISTVITTLSFLIWFMS